MTEPSSQKPDNTSADNNLKGLIIKGVVGAISLAGATAIPLIVQKYLAPSAPPAAEAPAPTTSPATATSPAPTVSPAQAEVAPANTVTEATIAPLEKAKGKRKKDKD